MNKYRIRFVEEVHEDGLVAMEVVVAARTDHDAIARATRIVVEFGGNFTSVAYVQREED